MIWLPIATLLIIAEPRSVSTSDDDSALPCEGLTQLGGVDLGDRGARGEREGGGHAGGLAHLVAVDHHADGAESAESPTFYQIPYRALVPRGPGPANVLVAGRLTDADRGAYGAIRVIVNCNQTGEAAGAAAFLCLDSQTQPARVDPRKLRETLARHGSVVL